LKYTHLRSEIQEASGQTPRHRPGAVSTFRKVAGHVDLADYLTHCVCDESWELSGLMICGYSQLVQENLESVSVGRLLYPHGFLVLATAANGDAVGVDSQTGAVYSFPREQFSFAPPDTPQAIREEGREIGAALEQAFTDLFNHDPDAAR
jgi:hypothetical protein